MNFTGRTCSLVNEYQFWGDNFPHLYSVMVRSTGEEMSVIEGQDCSQLQVYIVHRSSPCDLPFTLNMKAEASCKIFVPIYKRTKRDISQSSIITTGTEIYVNILFEEHLKRLGINKQLVETNMKAISYTIQNGAIWSSEYGCKYRISSETNKPSG